MLHEVARGRRAATIVGTVAVVTMLGSAAQAVPMYLGDNSYSGYGNYLIGAKHSRWGDVSNDADGCESDQPGYTPVEDGEMGTSDILEDAYDGGLLLMVGPPTANPDDASTFVDGDDVGDKSGEQLKVGPDSTGGLLVTRWDRALSKSPTLRSLISLRNPSGSARTRDIYWDSDMGSDGETEIRRTSNGSASLVNASRWVVTSDDATTVDDPVLTHVLWGKRARVKTAEIHNNPGGGSDCITTRMRVRIPAKSTVYLLFFTEMNRSHSAAFTSAKKFNTRILNSALLSGIKPGVRSKVVNWDLS